MYNYFEDEGYDSPYFYFYTKHNLTYYVSFIKMDVGDYPLNNVYSLDFGEINNNKGKNDTLISPIILEIIIKFIQKDESIVVHYLCENGDERQLYRKKLFTKWFSICDMNNWVKYDYDFENVNYNVSFLYNSDIYNTELMESEILLTLDVYERAKNN